MKKVFRKFAVLVIAAMTLSNLTLSISSADGRLTEFQDSLSRIKRSGTGSATNGYAESNAPIRSKFVFDNAHDQICVNDGVGAHTPGNCTTGGDSIVYLTTALHGGLPHANGGLSSGLPYSGQDVAKAVATALQAGIGGHASDSYTVSYADSATNSYVFSLGVNDTLRYNTAALAGANASLSLITDGGLTAHVAYTGQNVAAALQTALIAKDAGGETYTVSYIPATQKFKIVKNLWVNGIDIAGSGDALSTAALYLGFTSTLDVPNNGTGVTSAEPGDYINRFNIRGDGGNAINPTIYWADATSTATSTLGFIAANTVAVRSTAAISPNETQFTIITGVNDKFTLDLDGQSSNGSETITVTAGNYIGHGAWNATPPGLDGMLERNISSLWAGYIPTNPATASVDYNAANVAVTSLGLGSANKFTVVSSGVTGTESYVHMASFPGQDFLPTIDMVNNVPKDGRTTAVLVAADHTLSFKTAQAVPAFGQVVITFPSGFVIPTDLVFTDVDFAVSTDGTFNTLTLRTLSGVDGVNVYCNPHNPTPANSILFHLDATGIAAGQYVQVKIGRNTNEGTSPLQTGKQQIYNPATTGMYQIAAGTFSSSQLTFARSAPTSPVHTGAGLSDITTSATATNATNMNYRVQVDSAGTTDTIRWSDDAGVNWNANYVPMTGAAQKLSNGITVTFAATTGHAGPTISASTPVITGTGTLTTSGTYLGTSNNNYRVEIESLSGGVAGVGGQNGTAYDNYRWSKDGGTTWVQQAQPILSTNELPLSEGVKITFNTTTTLHQVGDRWTFTGTIGDYWDFSVGSNSGIVWNPNGAGRFVFNDQFKFVTGINDTLRYKLAGVGPADTSLNIIANGIVSGTFITGAAVATSLQTTFNAIGVNTYTVTYSATTNLFTIKDTNAGGTATFIATGSSDTASTAAAYLGFTSDHVVPNNDAVTGTTTDQPGQINALLSVDLNGDGTYANCDLVSNSGGGIVNGTELAGAAAATGIATALSNCNDTETISTGGTITKTFTGTGSGGVAGLTITTPGPSNTYTGTTTIKYLVEIDGTGTPGTFHWSIDGGTTWQYPGTVISGAAQPLSNNINIALGVGVAHTKGARWMFSASPTAAADTYNVAYNATTNKFTIAKATGTADAGINFADAANSTAARTLGVTENKHDLYTNGLWTSDIVAGTYLLDMIGDSAGGIVSNTATSGANVATQLTAELKLAKFPKTAPAANYAVAYDTPTSGKFEIAATAAAGDRPTFYWTWTDSTAAFTLGYLADYTATTVTVVNDSDISSTVKQLDTAYTSVYIVDNDQITVSAGVDPNLAIEINGGLAFSKVEGDRDTLGVDFGALEPNAFYRLGGAKTEYGKITIKMNCGPGANEACIPATGDYVTIRGVNYYFKRVAADAALASNNVYASITGTTQDQRAAKLLTNLYRAINSTDVNVRANIDRASNSTLWVLSTAEGLDTQFTITDHTDTIGNTDITTSVTPGVNSYFFKDNQTTWRIDPAGYQTDLSGVSDFRGHNIKINTNAADGYTLQIRDETVDNTSPFRAWVDTSDLGFGIYAYSQSTRWGNAGNTAGGVNGATLVAPSFQGGEPNNKDPGPLSTQFQTLARDDVSTARDNISLEYMIRINADQTSGNYQDTLDLMLSAQY